MGKQQGGDCLKKEWCKGIVFGGTTGSVGGCNEEVVGSLSRVEWGGVWALFAVCGGCVGAVCGPVFAVFGSVCGPFSLCAGDLVCPCLGALSMLSLLDISYFTRQQGKCLAVFWSTEPLFLIATYVQ